MTELQPQLPAVEEIKQIIKEKKWYVNHDGEFSMVESIKEILRLISLRIGKEVNYAALAKITEAIEKSFSPEALAKTAAGYFIDLLLRIDPDLILWTEGDPAWQKVKAENTTILDKVAVQRVEFISKAKTDHLLRIMTTIAAEQQG